MPVDFSNAAKAARAQIAVPAIDMNAIGVRSRTGVGVGLRMRLRRLAVVCAFTLGAIGAGVAFAANAGGVRVWLFGDKALLEIKSFAMTREPMPADLKRIAQSATFSVVWPVGIPDARIAWVAYAPADHPNFLTISYLDGSGHATTGVSIVDSRSVQTNRALLPKTNVVGGTTPYIWRVGEETVFMTRGHNAARVAAIRSAMRKTSASASLSENEAVAASIIVAPGAAAFVETAERIARRNSVLLPAARIPELARLSARNKPFADGRTVIATNIPSKNGEPDYAHATLQFAHAIAIPAPGVRDAAAVLARAHVGRTCRCAVLIHHSTRGYTIWRIDAKTGKATAL